MAYAIIRTGGKQFRVEPGQVIRIPTLAEEAGAKITFGDIALSADGDKVRAGAPSVAGASVTAEVVRHGRGKKIIVFKMKRRKNYAKKQGHRQGFTDVKITGIALD